MQSLLCSLAYCCLNRENCQIEDRVSSSRETVVRWEGCDYAVTAVDPAASKRAGKLRVRTCGSFFSFSCKAFCFCNSSFAFWMASMLTPGGALEGPSVRGRFASGASSPFFCPRLSTIWSTVAIAVETAAQAICTRLCSPLASLLGDCQSWQVHMSKGLSATPSNKTMHQALHDTHSGFT